MKRFLFSILALQLFAGSALADFNNAVVYYARGQYDQAYLEMRSLAEQSNHHLAEYYLGIMYANGQGVEQSYEDAAKWFRKSAEQSVSPAQYRLGQLYMNGQGVPRDAEFAYAWFSVAIENGNKQAGDALEEATSSLSTRELDAAKTLAAEYIEKYKKKEKPDVIKR